MTLCVCGENGYFHLHKSLLPLCETCYVTEFERSVVKRIPKFVKGHSVAIALSTGKDSVTLLNILAKNQKKLRIPKIYCITLEEGMSEINVQRAEIFRYLKGRFPDVKFIQQSYQDLFKHTLPDFLTSPNHLNQKYTPCAICGVLRRHALIQIASDIPVKYFAMGNTLNDEAATILINIIRGNPQKNLRHLVSYKPKEGLFKPIRIKPLERMNENSIINYIEITDLKTLNIACPYAKHSLRSIVNEFLNNLQSKSSNILYNIIASGKREIDLENQTVSIQQCEICSSLTPKKVCSACRLITHYFGTE